MENIRIWGAGLACVDVVKNSENEKVMLGGTCANVLSILAMLGHKVSFIQANYLDEWGQWINSELKYRNIEIYNFANSSMSAPIIVEVLSENSKHHFITVCPICGKRINLLKLPNRKQVESIQSDLDKPNLFYYDRISEGIKYLAKLPEKQWNFYEPNSCRVYNTFLAGLKSAHIVKFSKERIPDSYINNLLEDLEDSKVKLIIISMGQEGIKYSCRGKNRKLGEWKHIQSSKMDTVIDSSGAGDWLTAIFSYYFLEKYPECDEQLDEDIISNYLDKAQSMTNFACQYLGAQGIFEDDEGIKLLNKVFGLNLKKRIQKESSLKGVCEYCKSLV